MLGTLIRCSVAAVASIALLAAFVIAPEEFIQAKKPNRTGRGEKSQRSRPGARSAHTAHRKATARD